MASSAQSMPPATFNSCSVPRCRMPVSISATLTAPRSGSAGPPAAAGRARIRARRSESPGPSAARVSPVKSPRPADPRAVRATCAASRSAAKPCSAQWYWNVGRKPSRAESAPTAWSTRATWAASGPAAAGVEDRSSNPRSETRNGWLPAVARRAPSRRALALVSGHQPMPMSATRISRWTPVATPSLPSNRTYHG